MRDRKFTKSMDDLREIAVSEASRDIRDIVRVARQSGEVDDLSRDHSQSVLLLIASQSYNTRLQVAMASHEVLDEQDQVGGFGGFAVPLGPLFGGRSTPPRRVNVGVGADVYPHEFAPGPTVSGDEGDDGCVLCGYERDNLIHRRASSGGGHPSGGSAA